METAVAFVALLVTAAKVRVSVPTLKPRPAEAKCAASSVLTAACDTRTFVAWYEPVDGPVRLAGLAYAGAAPSELPTLEMAQTELYAARTAAGLTAYRLTAAVASLGTA